MAERPLMEPIKTRPDRSMLQNGYRPKPGSDSANLRPAKPASTKPSSTDYQKRSQ